jgi:ATP-dependent DNA ligase
MSSERGGRGERRDTRAAAGASGPPETPDPAEFPELDLPVRPVFPPMEAAAVQAMPGGEGWLFEPKWDGFRCLAFRDGSRVVLQSKSGQPLARYFPEVVEALGALPLERFVLDGEIVLFAEGRLDFDGLLQRMHPAASRIRKLAAEAPGTDLVFDLLVDEVGAHVGEPLERRRERLEAFFGRLPGKGLIRLSPATRDREIAERGMRELGAVGLDGVVAKRLDASYRSGERTSMQKIKRLRTADCVVGGFRYGKSSRDVGWLLLGLYDDDGRLDHVGFAASFTAEERRALVPIVEALIEPPGFTGNAPGGPSRWSPERSSEWQPRRPTLVCEVRYDHFSGGRFRHGTRFLRWRPDQAPAQCTYAQLDPPGDAAAQAALARKAG